MLGAERRIPVRYFALVGFPFRKRNESSNVQNPVGGLRPELVRTADRLRSEPECCMTATVMQYPRWFGAARPRRAALAEARAAVPVRRS